MARRNAGINSFCTVFGAGLFLCAIAFILAHLSEAVFHDSSSPLPWLIAIPIGGRVLVQASQSKFNKPVTFLWAALGYVGFFGALGIMGISFLTWAWRTIG